ncbi:MAG: YcgN family cysteine cluster protein [Pseudomonadales bacterium]|nr:YcgN family cysteine cluster protein [Pseudomonadales bacterium]
MDKDVRNKFWELPLEELSTKEWELLCDGCGRCCLKKIQDEETEELFWTRIACRFLDESSCRCTNYSERTTVVPTCLNVKEMYQENLNWMPDTCAYRLRAEDKPLYSWHPLLAESNAAIVEAGVSVLGKTLSEEFVHPSGYQEHVIRWVES